MVQGKSVVAGQVRRETPVYDSYGRLSKVPETGELEKIVTQLLDNRRVIERLGGVLGEELADGMSAWSPKVRRPGWERLLARAQAGESDGIVVWHTDRLFRLPRDLEKLIALADSGFTVVSAHGTRSLDDPDDRFILRIEVAQAAKSSDDAQRRIKRRLDRLRRRGVVQYRARCFGFPGLDRSGQVAKSSRDRQVLDLDALMRSEDVAAEVVESDEVDVAEVVVREPVSDELLRRERAALRDGTRAVLAGVTLSEVASEWNSAGLRTVTGKLWNSILVRAVLARPRNAGLIEHEGELVGRMPGEPIVEVGDFERFRALLAGRRRGRAPGAVYVGSGILRCGLCGHALSGRPHTGTYPDGQKRRQYACVKSRGGCGKVAVDVRAVDRELRGFVLDRLSDRQHAAALTAARARVADRLSEVEAEIRECERLQKALAERLGRRDRAMTLDAFDAANEPLARDLVRLSAEREVLSGGESGGPVDALGLDEVAAQWDAGQVSERRAMLTAALGRERVSIAAATATGRGKFDPTRVKIPTTTTV
jgi:site-specific DNA recombinase